MENEYERKYHRLERDHFWFRGVHGLLRQLVSRVEKGARVLDVGCSSGVFLEQLKEEGFDHLTGIDISSEAIALCQSKGLHAEVMDAAKPEYGDAYFDLIIAANVIEHIEDDGKALKEWQRILAPGGTLIVLTSAYQFLWSDHDRVNQHYRRYGRRELNQKIKDAGLSVERSSFWNTFLLGPIIAARFLRRLITRQGEKAKDDLEMPLGFINALLTCILNFETFLLKGANLPFGVTVFAVAKKK